LANSWHKFPEVGKSSQSWQTGCLGKKFQIQVQPKLQTIQSQFLRESQDPS